ncbi:MAG: hypothetical protein O7J95_13835 [Planctomycetota bacterium]|nr:hypothetical protein [Planctomycetota bacterium]
MKRAHGADVAPVHQHIRGFRLEGAVPPGGIRYYTLLRTPQSKALHVDKRFQEHPLILSGRIFPGTTILEVSDWRWIKDGKLYEVYYWCEICSIRGIDPGLCACCQGEVTLREKPVSSPER